MAYCIPIHGKARSGKNEVARILKEELEGLGFNVRIDAFARPIKELVGQLFELPVEKVDKIKDTARVVLFGEGCLSVISLRRVLQWLGTEVGREYCGCVWVYNLWERNRNLKEDDVLIITDVRFEDELGALQTTSQFFERCFLVKVVGRGGLQGQEASHPSEMELSDKFFEFVLYNDGTIGELEAKVKSELVPRFLEFVDKKMKGGQNDH